MTLLHVEVTAEDIAEGELGEAQYCPVALALCRVTSETWQVYGHAVKRERDGWRTTTPAIVRRKVRAFDNLTKIRPFAFDIEVPE